MTSHRSPVRNCPECSGVIDAHTDVLHDAQPKPGDVSVCLYCGAWLVFADATLRLRSITEAEIESLDTETFLLLQRIGSARRQVMRNHPRAK